MTEIENDLLEGLTCEKKYIKLKFAYNEIGDKLFEQLMKHEKYYLAIKESEILTENKLCFLELFNENEIFNIVDLGSGSGEKTEILIDYFLKEKQKFNYLPVDFSLSSLQILEKRLKNKYSYLSIQYINNDYFKAIEKINTEHTEKKIITFFGNSIGNMNEDDRTQFLMNLNKTVNKNDVLLIGFDLRKNPNILCEAYNNDHNSNLHFNMIDRLNQELNINLDKKDFEYYSSYSPVNGLLNFNLISKKRQTINIEKLDISFELEEWENIDCGHSQKFTLKEIKRLAEKTGFEVIEHLTDKDNYFVDSVWRIK